MSKLIDRPNKETILMTIENFRDRMELFDNGVEDEIEFELDADNLDIFFSEWDTYVDSDDPFWSLKIDDVKAIKHIRILIATDVPEIEDLDGEGIYDVVGCKCELADKVIREDGEEPIFEDFLEFTGTVTFKITPNHPVP